MSYANAIDTRERLIVNNKVGRQSVQLNKTQISRLPRCKFRVFIQSAFENKFIH